MAAFITRTLDSVLARGSGALVEAARFTLLAASATLPIGFAASFVESDGADLWVVSAGNVNRYVRAMENYSTPGQAEQTSEACWLRRTIFSRARVISMLSIRQCRRIARDRGTGLLPVHSE